MATAAVQTSEKRLAAPQAEESCLEFLIRERAPTNAAIVAGLIAVIGVAFCFFRTGITS